MLEYYGLKASSQRAVPVGGLVNVNCKGRDSIKNKLKTLINGLKGIMIHAKGYRVVHIK